MEISARFKNLGIQKRIMLYVTVGLVIMFGGFTLLGLRSNEQATELVYDERLNIAYTTAGIFERDFLHVARDTKEADFSTLAENGQSLDAMAIELLDHLYETDPFPFFQVRGLWLLDANGTLQASAGSPAMSQEYDVTSIISSLTKDSERFFVVLPAMKYSSPDVPFATIAVRTTDLTDLRPLVAIVHIVSNNSSTSYSPTSYWQTGVGLPSSSSGTISQTEYHLEVINPDGITVLGIGKDERPGEENPHVSAIQGLMAMNKAETLLHEPGPADTFEPHVMAVVPIQSTPFYLILEQPIDIALALPIQLRQRLLLLTGLAFAATLLVALITTRHVVKPTLQLNMAAQRIAQGDLSTPIKVNAQDEVATLADSLDIMRQKLSSAYQQVETANRGLESQVKERTARLGDVLGKVISAQEEERYRLARELHDETAQTLGALSIALDRARDSLPNTSRDAAQRISEAKGIATRLLEETRRLILDLRPLVLDDMGLEPAIRWYVETHLEDQGVTATVEISDMVARLPSHIEISLFRVIQEAVNNIVKHASAQHANIRLDFQDSVATVVISDDGVGFDVEGILGPSPTGKSVGLLGMQERVALLNGRIHIYSQPGSGTEVSVEIPTAEVLV